jgi:hypothetical protein
VTYLTEGESQAGFEFASVDEKTRRLERDRNVNGSGRGAWCDVPQARKRSDDVSQGTSLN